MTTKARTPATANKRGVLDTAVRVLALAQRPMTAKQMVRVMMYLGWWNPPRGGETPEATLGAAIYLEIQKEGTLARFVKIGKATFCLR